MFLQGFVALNVILSYKVLTSLFHIKDGKNSKQVTRQTFFCCCCQITHRDQIYLVRVVVLLLESLWGLFYESTISRLRPEKQLLGKLPAIKKFANTMKIETVFIICILGLFYPSSSRAEFRYVDTTTHSFLWPEDHWNQNKNFVQLSYSYVICSEKSIVLIQL